MTEKQRSIAAFGLFGAFFIVLVPPWKHGGYSLITNPPSLVATIDVSRLQIELLLLGIVCLALSLFATPIAGRIPGDSMHVDIAKMNNTKLIAIAAGFVFILMGVFGWNFYCKFKADEEARQLATLQQEQESANYAAAVEAHNEEVRAAQTEQEAQRLRIERLSRPVKLLLSKNLGDRVRADFFTYWKDNQLIYSLSISGSPEALETAVDAHPIFKFAMVGRDGLPLQEFSIPQNQLQPSRDRSGAVSSMVTPIESIPCEIKTYESIARVKLLP